MMSMAWKRWPGARKFYCSGGSLDLAAAKTRPTMSPMMKGTQMLFDSIGNLRRVLSAFALLALVVGVSTSAQAATPMYVLGKLTIPSFGNDTITGTYSSPGAPFYSYNYLGVPFGQDCNWAHGSRTVASASAPYISYYQCFATSSYQSAHDGSPLLGTGIVSITAGAGANPDFSLPASRLSVNLGSFPTQFTSTDFVKKPVNGVPGGSFSYYPPYIYSYTYADLKNAAGNFFAGGGPGNKTFNATVGGTAAGTLVTQAGANKFGGTMNLLGKFQSHFAYSISGGLSVGPDNWLVDWMGAGTVTPSGAVNVLTTTDTGTNRHNVLMAQNTVYMAASAFPWTTGTATAHATRGPFYTKMARAGYDNRTAGGAGNIQMVSPMLTHWQTPGAGLDYETGSIGVLTLTFAPEPSSAMLFVAGVSLLGLVYRNNRGA